MNPPRGAGAARLALLPRLPRLALPALLALLACAGRPAEPPAPPPAPAPRVVVETAAGGRHAVTVELARTGAEQERGLMHRRELAEDAGMLFVFPEAAPRSFWMKNTLIPLDLLFIDEAGVVAGIVRDAEPLSLTPRGPGPDVAARWVLEVRGGWAARHGVEPGARVRLEQVPRF
jgi:uncharacterized membrane protein (UPF0127 family)